MSQVEEVVNEAESKISKNLPIALIWAITFQMLASVWWVSSFAAKSDERFKNIEERQLALSELPERLAKQEQQMAAANQTLRDIRDDLRSYRYIQIQTDPPHKSRADRLVPYESKVTPIPGHSDEP